MKFLLEIFLSGLINGGIYALLAVGFSLIYGVAKIINLGHTAIYMVAAYMVYAFGRMMGLGFWPAAIMALAGGTLVAYVTYKLFVERIREHEVTVLLVTSSIATVLQEVMFIFFRGLFRGAPSAFSGFANILGVSISYQHLFSLGLIAVIVALILFILYRTKQGLAVRVTAQDREIANLMGINVPRICLMAVIVASFLAAVAGVVVSPIFVLSPTMWTGPLVTAIAIVILGGLGSIKGSFIGAFMLAYAEVLVVHFVPGGTFLRDAVAMCVMLGVLLIRPEGLYGIAFEEERL